MGNEGNEPVFEFGLRPGTSEDLDFIADSWRRSFDDAPTTRCPGGLMEYIATQRQVIAQCLRTSSVLVAYPRAPEEVTNQILGWVCFRKSAGLTVVHYLYVKPTCRRKEERMGWSLLAMALSREPGCPAMFHTHAFSNSDLATVRLVQRLEATGTRVIYNPALIFAPEAA